MAQEVIRQTGKRNDRREAAESGGENRDTTGALALSFARQKENNLKIKGAMAKELAAMGLTAESIQQILHLDDDVAF